MVTQEDLRQAKQGISEGKQRVQQVKQEIQERKRQAREQEKKLAQEEKKLPKKSQRLLRSGLYSGLEGRKRRRAVSGIKKEIGKRKKDISSMKKEIEKFEGSELKAFESEIKQREKEVADVEKHQKAINLAQDVYYGSTSPMIFFYGNEPLAKEYFDRMKKIEISQVQLTSPVYETNIIRKPVQFPENVQKKLREEGFGGFGIETKPLTPKRISTFNIKPPRDLSRTDLTRDFSKLSDLKVGEVSKSTQDLINKPFLTTGSPKRLTPLTSLKPSRPPTPSKPLGFKKTKLPKVKSSFEIKPKTGKKYGELFFGKKTKKGSKKKSIWGF